MLKLKKFRTISLSCLLLPMFLAGPAKADQIENLVFTGTATCEDSFCSSFGSGPLTGTYSLDVTTQTIVGAWSFSTPFGVISSTAAGSFTEVVDRFGDVNPEFGIYNISTFADFVQFYFPSTDPQEIGALATNLNSDACLNIPSFMGGCNPGYLVTGTTALAVATPEPSSLLLLGLGMLGVLGLGVKRSLYN
jgi:hypothetical protein